MSMSMYDLSMIVHVHVPFRRLVFTSVICLPVVAVRPAKSATVKTLQNRSGPTLYTQANAWFKRNDTRAPRPRIKWPCTRRI